jgi:NADPH-dependent 2,4-dienoyl-CoA reductase/sulfur reductase-like enzyme
MKRRDFLTKSLIAGGTISLGIGCRRELSTPSDGKQPVPEPALAGLTGRTITEPARQIPVLAGTDVLVVGGGPAGTAAAIAASRPGAETWLVERYNHLGGLWTGGLVLPLLSTHAVDRRNRRKQVIYGIGGEMSRRLKDLGMSISEVNPVVDPEAAKYVMDERISESGVKILYHAWATGAIMRLSTNNQRN